MTQQDRKRRAGPERTRARVQPSPGSVLASPRPRRLTRGHTTTAAAIRSTLALPALWQLSRSLCAPSAPATHAGPSAVTPDIHQSPPRPRRGSGSHASPGPRHAYLARTKHDPVVASKVRRPTRWPWLLCALCGASAQEMSPPAAQTEGVSASRSNRRD